MQIFLTNPFDKSVWTSLDTKSVEVVDIVANEFSSKKTSSDLIESNVKFWSSSVDIDSHRSRTCV